jgi:hypothetical protein
MATESGAELGQDIAIEDLANWISMSAQPISTASAQLQRQRPKMV